MKRRSRLVDAMLPVGLSAAGANPLDRRGLARLGIVGALPDLCVPHGRPPVKTYTGAITFRGVDEYGLGIALEEGLSRISVRRGWTREVGGDPEPDAILDVPMAMCRRCKFRVDLIQFLFLATVFVGICFVVGALASAQAGARDLALVFAYAILPGWFPCGLLLAVYFYTHARPRWKVRRTHDRRHIVVRAHPRFAERIDRAGG